MITPVQAEAIMVMADRMEETIKQVGDSLVAALQEIKGLRALVKIQETADKDTAAFMSEHVHDKRVSRETEAMPLG
jgi:exosome complex RNA-binding protein Csl4